MNDLRLWFEDRLIGAFGKGTVVEDVYIESHPCDISDKVNISMRIPFEEIKRGYFKSELNEKYGYHPTYPEAKKIIFSDPATIVIWKDGSKTIVKCSESDKFDPEKGLAMCYCKKFLGEKNYKNKIVKEAKAYTNNQIDIFKALLSYVKHNKDEGYQE